MQGVRLVKKGLKDLEKLNRSNKKIAREEAEKQKAVRRAEREAKRKATM